VRYIYPSTLTDLDATVDEQRAIAVVIDDRLAEFDRSIAFITKEIELLREYRTRLVADVVTGKLDVREAAARLPDEAPPDVTEDDPMAADEEGAEDAADAENTAA